VKTYLSASVLTVINLALFIFLLVVHAGPAIIGEVAPVLRSKAFIPLLNIEREES